MIKNHPLLTGWNQNEFPYNDCSKSWAESIMKSTPKRCILSILRLPVILPSWQWTHHYLLLVLFLEKDRHIFCRTPFSPKPPLTHSCHKLLEVDERIPVLIQEAEEPPCQHRGMCPTGPGGEADKQLLELLHVYAILLQVGQALVPAGSGRTVIPPVTAHQVLGLWRERINRADYAAPQEWRLLQLKNSIDGAKNEQRRDISGNTLSALLFLVLLRYKITRNEGRDRDSRKNTKNNLKWKIQSMISGFNKMTFRLYCKGSMQVLDLSLSLWVYSRAQLNLVNDFGKCTWVISFF